MKLVEYIKGQRHGKDAHRIEREAMQDPFLSDAIDGFDVINGDHLERIGEMRRRISRQTRRINHWFAYVSTAASVVVLLTIGGYFIFKEEPEDLLARSESSIEERVDDRTVFDEPAPSGEEINPEEDAADNSLSDSDIQYRVDKDDSSTAISRKEIVTPSAMSTSKKLSSQEISTDDQVQQEDILAAVEVAEVEELIVDESDEALSVAQVAESEEAKNVQEQKRPASVDPATTHAIMGQKEKKVAKLKVPEPQMGWKAYRKYLKESLRRPSEGDCVKSKGTVEVTFHVDENGTPYDFVIGKSLCPDADTEAIRLVKEGGLWTNKSFKRMTVEVKF